MQRLPRILAAASFALTATATLLDAGIARAGGLDLDLVGARDIGRAGATLVSGDGALALLRNPAGAVRRADHRVQLGIAVHDADVAYQGEQPGSPEIADRGTPTLAPVVGGVYARGRLAVGVAYARLGALDRQLPEPAAQTEDEVARLFPHRYAGTHLALTRDRVAVAASLRASDWLGVGVAVSADRVGLEESRVAWAGFSARDPIGAARRDIVIDTEGRDAFVPGATVGLLIAPLTLPLEMALAATLVDASRLTGQARARRARPEPFPTIGDDGGPATARLPARLAARAGLRYLGDWLVLEANGEIEHLLADARPWQHDDVVVVDDSGATGTLTGLPLLATPRARASVRAAADIEVVDGFLWLTGGYAFRTESAPQAYRVPVAPGLASHTIGVGAESMWRGVLLSVGYARSASASARVTDSQVSLVNPFAAGTAPAGNGTYDQSHDTFALAVELSLP